MLTVGEVSRLTGVSVRTLHHYDAIGLLKPTRVTEAGYRLYDEAALVRLQAILLLREVRFPLGEIKAMLDSPGFCPGKALAQRIELLETQRRRLGELIALARAIQQKGVWAMEVQAFDMRGMDRLRAEAKARWGATAAYRHYAQREESDGTGRTEQWRAFFAGLGALRHLPPDDSGRARKDRRVAGVYRRELLPLRSGNPARPGRIVRQRRALSPLYRQCRRRRHGGLRKPGDCGLLCNLAVPKNTMRAAKTCGARLFIFSP